jgi:hypothetical protein
MFVRMTESLPFTAPWGKLLWGITLVASAVMLAVPFFLHRVQAPRMVMLLLGGGMVLTWVSCALFAVRGYKLEAGDLVIERPFWDTRVPLAGLEWSWGLRALYLQGGLHGDWG